MSLDLSSDYLIFDGLQTVQYLQKRPGEAFAGAVVVNNALLVTTPKQVLEGGVISWKQETTWHFWAHELAGIVPRYQDRVIDAAGVIWMLSGRLVFTMLTQRWECEAITVQSMTRAS